MGKWCITIEIGQALTLRSHQNLLAAILRRSKTKLSDKNQTWIIVIWTLMKKCQLDPYEVLSIGPFEENSVQLNGMKNQ